MKAVLIGESDIREFRSRGIVAASGQMPAARFAPLNDAACALLACRPRQEWLSGVHNPFGNAIKLLDPWKFLDVCEDADLLDAVCELLGPDVVLWDSELYLEAAAWDAARIGEGRHWPVDPLAGLVVDVALATNRLVFMDVHRAPHAPASASGAHYVIRYMPATSFYNRDPRFPPNRLAMEERPLVNYLNRPIWLVRGEDRAGSDFARGFAPVAPGWAADRQLFQKTEV